ncbi:hypothetical protein ACK3LN_000370 [Campylobacter upsaliensis]
MVLVEYTKTGLVFEGKVDLAAFLSQQSGYIVDSDGKVFYDDELVAQIFKKHKFYSFLKERGVDWRSIISKKGFCLMIVSILSSITHFLSLSVNFSKLQDRLVSY